MKYKSEFTNLILRVLRLDVIIDGCRNTQIHSSCKRKKLFSELPEYHLVFYFHCLGLDFCYQQEMIYWNDTRLPPAALHCLYSGDIRKHHNVSMTSPGWRSELMLFHREGKQIAACCAKVKTNWGNINSQTGT